MKLIAKKPCSFGGKKFYIGDEIPAEYILDPKAQEKLGVLACVGEEITPVTVPIAVQSAKGKMELNITGEGMQSIFDVLTGKANEVEPIIKEMTDGDALILLHITDSRKSIQSAAEARANELEEAGEQ